MTPLSPALFTLFACLSFAAPMRGVDLPVANVITNPGAEYGDASRTWQGIPGIERAPKGRLWATWYSGDQAEGAPGTYALAATSSNNGTTWSKPALVIEGPAGTKIADPLPWLDPVGRLWIFWAQSTSASPSAEPPRAASRATFAIRTENPDASQPVWSKPILVHRGGILFGKPIVTKSGGWLAPFFRTGKVDGPETGALLSTDSGEHWKWVGGTTVPTEVRNFSEATLAQRADASVWMVFRTLRGLYESESRDEGRSWSAPRPLAKFQGPSTRASMRRLASGSFLLVYHDSSRNAKGTHPRERLTAWCSDDEGRTWPHRLVIDERPSVSYPDITQAPDGRIYVAYDHGRYHRGEKELLLAVLREEDLRAGKFTSPDARQKLLINRALGYGNAAELKREQETAAAIPPKEKFDVYLLIGQSNMAGRGILSTTEPISRLRLLSFSPNNAWTAAVEPLHHDKPAAVGVGLGMSFARAMADADRAVTIGVIPCAVGGTPLQRWMKGGDLYAQALERARIALAHGTLKGILWHQGESDSGTKETASSYAERLANMITDLRADLGAPNIPFVAGKLGDFLAPVTREGQPSFWPLVNEQLATIPDRVPHTAVVEATGLVHKGDGVHFDGPSLREFGRRYAKAMLRLQATAAAKK